MILLDLFCGAGGAAAGYARAGFDVIGVDIRPQPHYPFAFVQADALDYAREHGRDFDVIHASPPCQAYSTMRRGLWKDREHPDLIDPTRALLRELGRPFVIENVEGAAGRMVDPVKLCGTMFGLASGAYRLRRHRMFEAGAGFALGFAPASCAHIGPALPVYGHAGGRSKRDGLTFPGVDAWREGMGIDWMTGDELAESIPPAYTEWIGARLLEVLG